MVLPRGAELSEKVQLLKKLSTREASNSSGEVSRILPFFHHCSGIAPESTGGWIGYSEISELDVQAYSEWYKRNKGQFDGEEILAAYHKFYRPPMSVFEVNASMVLALTLGVRTRP